MVRTFLRAVTVVASLSAFLSNATAAPAHLTFVMPNSPTPYLLAFLIAQDLGWNKADGLDVEEKVVTGDANALRTLVSGDSDVTYLGSGTAMQAAIKGAPVKILGAWQALIDYQVVAHDKLSTLNDVAGKKWASTGAGTMTQIIPEMVLKKHNLADKAAQFFGVGGLAARYKAVVAGTVDATILDTFYATLAARNGKAKVILSVADELPGLGYNYILVTKTTADDVGKRAAIETFVRNGLRGVRYINEHPDEAAKVLAHRLKSTDASLETETLKTMNKMKVWGLDGGLDRKVFASTAAFYQKNGMLTGAVDYDKLVDDRFVKAALARLDHK